MLQKRCLKYLRCKPKWSKKPTNFSGGTWQTSIAHYCFLSLLHTDAEQHSSDTTSWSATTDSCYHRWHSLKSPIWFNQGKEKKVFLTWQALTHNASAAGCVFYFFPLQPATLILSADFCLHHLISSCSAFLIATRRWRILTYVWGVFHLFYLTYDMPVW